MIGQYTRCVLSGLVLVLGCTSGRHETAIDSGADTTLGAIPVPVGSSAIQDPLRIVAVRVPDIAGELLFEEEFRRQRDVPIPTDVTSQIYLMRLYEVPEIGGCEGTDEACLRHYALLLVTGGLPPGVSLYDLGTVGEIIKIEWVASPPPRTVSVNPSAIVPSDEATIVVTVQNLPTAILEADTTLTRKVKRYRLHVDMRQARVEEIP